jgi:predicted DNA-binding protein (MmcQ/YjbR family)
MNIEDKIFSRKRFIIEKMLDFGFTKTDGGYYHKADFMDGDFKAVLTVSDNGKIQGTVIDKMNGEEYRQLRNDSFVGAYVNSVRSAYEKLLIGIAEKCCGDVLFSSDQANRVAERILSRFNVEPDYPFEQSQYQSYGVFRHGDNSKWFAIIMNVKRQVILKNADKNTVDIINLKTEPDNTETLLKRDGIYLAYHMNHKNWITVALDDSLSDDDVMILLEESFRLTESKK